MKLRKIASLAAALLFAGAAVAQGSGAYLPGGMAAGRLIRMADFAPTDMLNFSQYNYSFGTARSAAMGGAFVSLGADLSSMSINPAGLGMYQSSEFSISPSLTWTQTASSWPGGSYYAGGDNNFTRFTLGNIGMALNTMQSSHGMVSFTFGFAYNKLADYNYNTSIGLNEQMNSITEVMALQVRGINHDRLSSDVVPERNFAPNMWGAALAYQVYGIDYLASDPSLYTSMRPEYPNEVADNYLTVNSLGSIGEYDISGGMNFNNRVYLGFTLGIQSIYQKQYAYYEENFNHIEKQATLLDKQLGLFFYDQYTRVSGTGVNFKAGIIVRPIDELRIGLAIHTPTFTALDREYGIVNIQRNPQRITADSKIISANSITDQWAWQYTTPTRIMLGASYQFGNVALLSADWEHAWYNGMRLGTSNDYPVDSETRTYYKEDIKYAFKGVDNLRVGLEVKPVPMLALRAGYAYYGSPVRENDDNHYITPDNDVPYSVLDAPVANRTNSFSLGAGVRFGGFSIDAAYVYAKTDYTKYALFWYDGPGNNGVQIPEEDIPASGPVESSMKRGIATLTLGFRF